MRFVGENVQKREDRETALANSNYLSPIFVSDDKGSLEGRVVTGESGKKQISRHAQMRR